LAVKAYPGNLLFDSFTIRLASFLCVVGGVPISKV
jgi:hypothetical protein